MNRQHIMAAMIHDQVGQTLVKILQGAGRDNPFQIRLGPNETLLGQLAAPGDGPPRISVGFGLDIVDGSVSALLDRLPVPDAGLFARLKDRDLSDVLDDVRNELRDKLGLFDKQKDAIANLMSAHSPGAIRDVAETLFGGVLDELESADDELVNRVKRLRQFLGSDIGTALPFAAVVGAAKRGLQNLADVPKSIEDGLLAYFFDPRGYEAVDGERVVSPVHVSDIKHVVQGAVAGAAQSAGAAEDAGIAAAVKSALAGAELGGQQLKGLFSKATAERYLRDITRVIVETAYDAARGMAGPTGRFNQVASGLGQFASPSKTAEAIVAHFNAWFRGFSSMAESAAMRAVEVGTQGVAEFQTNPLIAASAGSFAGTVARKLAQDSFLDLLTADLKRRPAGRPR